MAQNWDKCVAVVNTLMNLGGSVKCRYSLWLAEEVFSLQKGLYSMKLI